MSVCMSVCLEVIYSHTAGPEGGGHADLDGARYSVCFSFLSYAYALESDLQPRSDIAGDSDMLVRLPAGQSSATALTAMGVKVDFKTYRGMGHSACDEVRRRCIDSVSDQRSVPSLGRAALLDVMLTLPTGDPRYPPAA
jgi:acetyl esterase/lipase